MTEKQTKKTRTLVGTVVSTKMNKTIVVSVQRTYKHPLLGKVMRTTKKYPAHDEHGRAGFGDVVELVSSRPLSKTKRWSLERIIKSTTVAQV